LSPYLLALPFNKSKTPVSNTLNKEKDMKYIWKRETKDRCGKNKREQRNIYRFTKGSSKGFKSMNALYLSQPFNFQA